MIEGSTFPMSCSVTQLHGSGISETGLVLLSRIQLIHTMQQETIPSN